MANALDDLREGHERIKDWFDKFNSVGSLDFLERNGILAGLLRELEVHAAMEEDVFYPEVAQFADEGMKLRLAEAYEGHGLAKSLIDELKSASEEDWEYLAKVKLLEENIRRHMEEEETELFPMVLDNLESGALNDLAARMEEARKEFLSLSI